MENIFGIIAARLSIFLRPIELKVDRTEGLVKAPCAIHNWLNMTSSSRYFSPGSVDEEDVNSGTISVGKWRPELVCPLQLVNRTSVGYMSNNHYNAAQALHQEYAEAFSSYLSVPWQLRQLHL